jgi:sensor histidine kinase YesM
MIKARNKMTYRTKLLGFFFLAVSSTALVGLYTYKSSSVLMSDMTDLLNQTQEITTLYNELDELQFYFEDYLYTRSSDSLQSFYDYSNSLMNHNNQIKKEARFTDRGIKIMNISGMISHYLDVLDQAVIDKRNRKIDAYTAGYREAVKEHTYIGNYIETMMSNDLSNSAQRYIEIQREVDNNTALSYLMFGITVVLISVIIIIFSFELTKPISKLASYAKEVSKGNFDVVITEQKTSREISILYQTFRSMTASIREYVHELQEKQRLEHKLSEEKLNNLKMKSALHEAELLTLQSQVNPHFIFNTINIGAKVAMLQGDNVTCEYLENFAEIFRYNLKGLNYDAALSEEIGNIEAYMKLLITRFGDAIDFRLDVPEDEEVMDFILPRMTLQPLVENAYIHGIGKSEQGGIIEVTVKKEPHNLYITVSNTGEEIPADMVRLILSRKYKKEKSREKKGHTTGIGIDNVLNRLRLFYKKEDVMDITYTNGRTNFILKLPVKNKIAKG